MQKNLTETQTKLQEQEKIIQSQSDLIEANKEGVDSYSDSSFPLSSEDFFFTPGLYDEGLALLDKKKIVKT